MRAVEWTEASSLNAGYQIAKRAFQIFLDWLGLDYLDLYLIHQPMEDYYGAWRALEESCTELARCGPSACATFIQRGVVVIPKSVHKERLEENIDIWDFELTREDMNAIEKMDTGHNDVVDHFSPQTAKWLNGFKIHP